MERPPETRAATRQAGTSAAIGAALLLYFGFVALAEPTGTDLFSQSWWVLYHTLRVGGVALAAVTLWLWVGHPPALIVDGIITIVIGLLLILTGIGMLVDGGALSQPVINALCGFMFVSAGMYNARIYLHHRRQNEQRDIEDAVPADTRAGFFRGQQSQRGAAEDIRPFAAKEETAQTPPSPEATPPEGYLASFAKKRGQD